MFTYETTSADQAVAPASYAVEDRYLGYRDTDRSRSYAKYFRDETLPLPPHVPEVLLAGMAPTEYGYDIADAADMLSRPGHHKMETGWTRLDSGVVAVAVLTDMPGVTGEMWDWWMGWHSCESSRYKLWHPDAHQFTAVGRRAQERGPHPDRPAALRGQRFLRGRVRRWRPHPARHPVRRPGTLGFGASRPGGTVIAGRVGLSIAPVAFGWIVHQVRPTDSGAEMRSRFFLNHLEHLDLPATSVVTPPAGGAPVAQPDMEALGAALLHHCAAEMNHLASFLPALHEEFAGTP